MYFRPPYGEYNEKLLKILFKKGIRTFMWNYDTKDWDLEGQSEESIYGGLENELKKFKNIRFLKSWIPLQHELHERTIKMQEKIIDLILSMGYKFVPLNQCIRDPQPPYRSKL